jgi:integrase
VAELVSPPLLATGIRPEEARALPWDHLDLDAGDRGRTALRSSRRRHQDPRSRRILKLPELALTALRERKAAQAAERLKVGDLWQGTGLVFTTTVGSMLDQHNIRREFRRKYPNLHTLFNEATKLAGGGGGTKSSADPATADQLLAKIDKINKMAACAATAGREQQRGG